ncbi:MAG: hypothetical protein DCC68_23205, partial [Planctomycetota bacterium]
MFLRFWHKMIFLACGKLVASATKEPTRLTKRFTRDRGLNKFPDRARLRIIRGRVLFFVLEVSLMLVTRYPPEIEERMKTLYGALNEKD